MTRWLGRAGSGSVGASAMATEIKTMEATRVTVTNRKTHRCQRALLGTRSIRKTPFLTVSDGCEYRF